MTVKSLLSKISRLVGLPEELLLDLPCMRLEGFGRLMVENHMGISVLTPTLIRFRTKEGVVTLAGSDLKLDGIGANGLAVSGEIESIEMKRRGA